MKYIIQEKPLFWFEHSLPQSWQGKVSLIPHETWDDLAAKLGPDIRNHEFYVCSDTGYDKVARSGLLENDQGFCKALSLLANDKYKARSSLKSLKDDIPFTLCDDNVVNWPYNREDKLFAKPLSGTFNRGIVKDVKHGDMLPDIGEPYLIEKYIEDEHERMSFDCYVCGKQMGILTTSDNLFHKHLNEVKYHYVGIPSKFQGHPLAREKCFEVLKELKEVTGCNNQVICIELFHVNGKFLVMEINPRMDAYTPIRTTALNVNPWVFMENLINGKVMEMPKPKKSAIIRCTYKYSEKPEYIQHDKNTFSINCRDSSNTFSMCDISKSYEDLIIEIDEKYPPADPMNPQLQE